MSTDAPLWCAGMPSTALVGGYAVAHRKMTFLQQRHSGDLLLPRAWLQQQLAGNILDEQGIGYWQGQPVYVFELEEPVTNEAWQWIGLRQYLLEGSAPLFKLLAFASQIGTWAREHRFCGGCGQLMQSKSDRRVRFCSDCGVQRYPHLSPSMIVLVTRGDEVLLARSQRFVSGMYSALAGYVEPGESVEDCVHREVAEEVSLKVANLRYIASQNWPFPHTMMLGYHADYLSGDIVPQPEEIEDAQWFNLNQLPSLPMQGSIARHLIELYRYQRLGGRKPQQPS